MHIKYDKMINQSKPRDSFDPMLLLEEPESEDDLFSHPVVSVGDAYNKPESDKP